MRLLPLEPHQRHRRRISTFSSGTHLGHEFGCYRHRHEKLWACRLLPGRCTRCTIAISCYRHSQVPLARVRHTAKSHFLAFDGVHSWPASKNQLIILTHCDSQDIPPLHRLPLEVMVSAPKTSKTIYRSVIGRLDGIHVSPSLKCGPTVSKVGLYALLYDSALERSFIELSLHSIMSWSRSASFLFTFLSFPPA